MRPPIKRFMVAVAHGMARSRISRLLPIVADRSPHLLRVLMYHRVDSPTARPDLSPATLSATPAGFAAQMKMLAEHFRVVDLEQVRKAAHSRQPLPPFSVLLTFDDAYLDFQQHAWPVLREMGLPATVFVPTGYADDPQRSFWWDRLHAAIANACNESIYDTRWGRWFISDRPGHRRELESRLMARLSRIPHHEAMVEVERMATAFHAPTPRPAVMSWDDLRAFVGTSVTLAPHSHSHPLMNRIGLEDARAEVLRSQQDLRDRLGDSPRVFAYPGGAYDARVVAMLAEEGFEMAFTTCRGVNHLGRCPRLELRRFNVGLRSTPELLWAQLMLPAYCVNPFWPLRSAS